MKKFQFKLEAYLKLKELEEDRVKIEVGNLNKEVQRCTQELFKLDDDIREMFDIQENLLKIGTNANALQYMPSFFTAKLEHIEQLKNYKQEVEKKRNAKLEELKHANGQVKLISNLKEKKRIQFKKALNKEIADDIEELNRIKRAAEEEL